MKIPTTDWCIIWPEPFEYCNPGQNVQWRIYASLAGVELNHIPLKLQPLINGPNQIHIFFIKIIVARSHRISLVRALPKSIIIIAAGGVQESRIGILFDITVCRKKLDQRVPCDPWAAFYIIFLYFRWHLWISHCKFNDGIHQYWPFNWCNICI